MKIRPYNPKDPADQDAIREIFFLSASRTHWPDDEAKETFFDTWTSFYFTHAEDLIFLAVDDGRALAYLTGCRDSAGAQAEIEKKIKSFAVFADLFARFPAHLHINAHPDARGRGIGSRLIEHFCSVLKKQKIGGVHLVTSPDSRNRGFYRKNGFDFEVEREFKGHKLLFMGRAL
jgi:GNAT superfamily N-acetyltransferase